MRGAIRCSCLMVMMLTLAWPDFVSSQSVAPRSATGAGSKQSQLIDVGGYRLNFKIASGKKPTVVLEPGGGGSSSDWRLVQEPLWRKTSSHVISYDRAGYGQSEAAPSSENVLEGEVEALHRALKNLGVSQDLILVGFSYSSFTAQFYAYRYPADVKGVVLVDPDTVSFFETYGVDRWMERWKKSAKGEMSPREARLHASFPATIERMKGVRFPQQIPAVVITSGLSPWGQREPETSAAWRKGHELFVQGAPNRELVVATTSGHYIPTDQPDLVIDTISTMVNRVLDKGRN